MSERSERLAADLGADRLTGAARVLAEEACRLVDRLDEFDLQIDGRAHAWLGISERLADMGVAEVTVDKVLAEARQYALALTTVLTRLAAMSDGQVGAAPAADVADEVARRRQEKMAAAALAAQQTSAIVEE